MPRRELVNILNLSFNKPQNNQPHHSKYLSIGIEFNLPRECFPSLSTNSMREMSVNSSVSLMDYVECMQAQSGKLTWAKQIERKEKQDPSLSYVPLETVYLKPANNLIYISHSSNTNNICSFPNLEPLVIPYQADQLADPQL